MNQKDKKIDKSKQALMQELGIENPAALPSITHVVVNAGTGKQRDDKSFIEAVQKDLAKITGQKPQEKRARKSVAGFGVRQGNLVGFKVTLRGERKNDFINRFVNITLPRVRDFRGIPMSSFDGYGNLNVGLREHLAFPEIDPEKTDVAFGVQVTFVTSTRNNKEALSIFKQLGFPLVEENPQDS